MTRFVYLAGPILHETDDGANDWRKQAAKWLENHLITGISPLRAERPHGDTYGFETLEGGGNNAIWAKNVFDLRTCDLMLAYLPKWSVGTLLEIGLAYGSCKPVVLVTNDALFTRHPCLRAACGWHFPDLSGGLQAVTDLLGGYTGGKNV